MKVESLGFEGEGMARVFENEKWMVGVKNWKPANDLAAIDCLERHNGTDELFVLLAGSCTILFANEVAGRLVIEAERMRGLRVYKVPRSLWHNTVTSADAKLVLIEDSSTSSENSDVMKLDEAQRARARELAG
jgi:hypothetical protein